MRKWKVARERLKDRKMMFFFLLFVVRYTTCGAATCVCAAGYGGSFQIRATALSYRAAICSQYDCRDNDDAIRRFGKIKCECTQRQKEEYQYNTAVEIMKGKQRLRSNLESQLQTRHCN